MLRLDHIQKSENRPCIVTTDVYVPISFRSYHGVLGGARHVSLRNGKDQLFEIKFPPDYDGL